MKTAHLEHPSATSSEQPAEVRWRFGSFTVYEMRRRVERSGQAVRVGPRSFDLLLQLLKRAGEFMSKDELLSTVWAGLVVEEGSVRVHMSTLRKALGEPDEGDGCDEWITNVPQRGYRFNGRVQREQAGEKQATARPFAPALAKLPVRLTELVGRDADVHRVLTALAAHRLVTIVGPGGIGKTTAAVRAAECVTLQDARVEAAFVDLSPLISQDHVPATMAQAVGATADMPDPVQAIVEVLQGRTALLLIDNCEHVLESLTQPIVTLLMALPDLRILATSREPLRLAGERVLRLAPLAVPDTEDVSLEQALRWPAVQLLVERAGAAGAGAPNATQGPVLARMARQLDGIPLAIELVAARLGVQSIHDLSLRLDDHLRLHARGARSVHPRHRTLAATMEWSAALLTPEELRLLSRLSVFRGRFDVESALRINAGVDGDASFDALISLANKSLVAFDANEPVAPYRLLDTTKSYAATLFLGKDDRAATLRCHALFMLDCMAGATSELSKLTAQAWIERYAYRLDDVRFAIGNCLAGAADTKTAACLVTASTALWFQLSLVTEYRDRAAAVLAAIDALPEPDKEAATWMNTALITALLHTAGPHEALDAACDRALAGALALGIPALKMQALWGRCTHDMFRGEYAAALRHSETFRALVEPAAEPSALGLSRRVSAMAHHFGGDFALSRRYSMEAIAVAGAARSHAALVGPDSAIAAAALLCRTLWIEGDTDKAVETAAQAVAGADAMGHAVSLCSALYGACAVALWARERELAVRWVTMMVDVAQRRGFLGWLRYAQWFAQGLQLETAPDRERHVQEVAGALALYDEPRREMLVTFCADWIDDALIARAERGDAPWVAAEVWRAAGRRSERAGQCDEAEGFYLRAIETAAKQGARAWQARAEQSLSCLRGTQAQRR